MFAHETVIGRYVDQEPKTSMPVATVSTPVLTVAPDKTRDFLLDDATELLMNAFLPDDIKFSHKNSSLVDMVSIDMCGNCGYEGLDKTDGYFFCVECGHTKGTVLDTSGEWRSFPSMQGTDQGRCGTLNNPLLPKTALTTMIVGGGNSFMKKLHRWSSSNHRESTKYQIFAAIQQAASRNGVCNAVIHQAHKYIAEVCDRMLASESVLRGSKRSGIVAACLYFAFKKVDCVRSVGEVADVLDMDTATVSLGIKYFGDMLVDNIIVAGDEQISAAMLIPRYCVRLGMPEPVQTAVGKVLKKADKTNVLKNHIPEAQCAACLWYVSKLCKLGRAFSKKRIGEICHVSDVTVAKCCKKLETEWLDASA